MLLRQIRLIAACVAFCVFPAFSLNLSEVLHHAWRAIRHFVWGHQWQFVSPNIRQCYDCQRYEILHDMGRAYGHYHIFLPIPHTDPRIQTVFDHRENTRREFESRMNQVMPPEEYRAPRS